MQGVGMTSLRTRERLVDRLHEQGVTHPKVLDLILKTPRHLFLDEALSHRAYEDTSLPIGHGQTLSQPYIVARMTDILLSAVASFDTVLEVGTGSGYQTAILAQCAKKVYSVERIKPLLDKARLRLRQLNLNNVSLKHSDGTLGWPEVGPFNAIISTAAPAEVPQSLKDQLGVDGVLVIPSGVDEQWLTLVVRKGDTSSFYTQKIEPVKFVPLLTGIIR